MSPDQKLQRINEVLEKLWVMGVWDGLLVDQSDLTTTDGLLTLAANYKTLESLFIPDLNQPVSIKSQQWKFSPSAPRIGDWTLYRGEWIAFDLGDTGTANLGVFDAGVVYDTGLGQYVSFGSNNGIVQVLSAAGPTPPSTGSARQYQIAGDPDYIDTLTFSGQAKRRYVYATDTAAIVAPDCFQALLQGVRAFHWYDVGDTGRAEKDFATALRILEEELGDVQDQEDFGSLSFEYETSGGSIPNVM